jgi:integral membrane protein
MARPRLLSSLLAMAFGDSGPALAVAEWYLQPPVTPIARQMYDLHYFIFWICVVIFVAVFGVMFYSLFRHRKSQGRQSAHFHENTIVEIVWTVIPFLILLFIAMPLKYLAGLPLAVRVVGSIHGALFLLFLAVLYRAARARTWPRRRSITALVASILPFGTFVFDASLRREIESTKALADTRELT